MVKPSLAERLYKDQMYSILRVYPLYFKSFIYRFPIAATVMQVLNNTVIRYLKCARGQLTGYSFSWQQCIGPLFLHLYQNPHYSSKWKAEYFPVQEIKNKHKKLRTMFYFSPKLLLQHYTTYHYVGFLVSSTLEELHLQFSASAETDCFDTMTKTQ